MNNIFAQFAVILGLSSILGYLVLRLKLPLVVAYLLTGVTLAAFTSLNSSSSFVLGTLPDIGIAFVLFLVGMELDLRELRAFGKPIVISTIGQVIISTLAGYAIAGALGFSTRESIFLGLGLSFSSTIVVVKMLLEKKELDSLYGKLSVGISLAEDLIAIVVLMLITVGSTALHSGLQESFPILALVAKGVGLFILTFVLSRYILGRIFDAVAKSTELLFFTAITWCFVFTTLALSLGFSVVIGAFLAGVALASSPYHFEIQGKVKPLRDFFIMLFFVYLGSQVRVGDILTGLPAILFLTLCALILKPIVYMLLLGLFGFRKHTLFQTCLNLSQVSEFSLIILVLGVRMGLVSQLALSVMAAVGVLSIITSSLLIIRSRQIYSIFSPFIRFFEHNTKAYDLEIKNATDLNDHIVVIGGGNIGGPVIDYLHDQKIPFLMMDFNPALVSKLLDDGVNVIYGDISDPEVLDHLFLDKAKLIISTAPLVEDNEILLEQCKRRKSKAVVVVRAEDAEHVKILRALGADYVIRPEKASGAFLVHQLRTYWPRPHFAGLG